MERIERRIAAGFLAAAFGLAPMGYAAAAEARTGQVRAESPLSAEAPLLGRIVITPSPEQLANIRLERRMIGLEKRANGGQRAGPPSAGGCAMGEFLPNPTAVLARISGCRGR